MKMVPIRRNPGDESMKVIEQLLKLQEIEFGPQSTSADHCHEASALRDEIPAPLLAHYDRFKARAKKAVALVHHGVCGGCRMKIPSGPYAALIRDDDVAMCEYCGRYLILAPPDPAPAKPARRARRKSADALVTA